MSNPHELPRTLFGHPIEKWKELLAAARELKQEMDGGMSWVSPAKAGRFEDAIAAFEPPKPKRYTMPAWEKFIVGRRPNGHDSEGVQAVCSPPITRAQYNAIREALAIEGEETPNELLPPWEEFIVGKRPFTQQAELGHVADKAFYVTAVHFSNGTISRAVYEDLRMIYFVGRSEPAPTKASNSAPLDHTVQATFTMPDWETLRTGVVAGGGKDNPYTYVETLCFPSIEDERTMTITQIWWNSIKAAFDKGQKKTKQREHILGVQPYHASDGGK